MAVDGDASSVDPKREILDVDSVAAEGERSGMRKGQFLSIAGRAETCEFETRDRIGDKLTARLQGEAARFSRDSKIAGIGCAARLETEMGDRFAANARFGELDVAREDFPAVDIRRRQIGVETRQRIRRECEIVALGDDVG